MDGWIEKELLLVNVGKTSTCVRAQGSSSVDITIGTERAVRGINEWKVE